MDPRTEKLLAERERKVASTPPLLRGVVRVLNDLTAWVKTHGLVVKLGSGAAVIGMLLAYNLLVAKPAERFEQQRMDASSAERVRTETAARQIGLTECLSKAEAEAKAKWNATCRARGERAGCALTARLTEELDEKAGQARNSCLMRFSLTAQ